MPFLSRIAAATLLLGAMAAPALAQTGTPAATKPDAAAEPSSAITEAAKPAATEPAAITPGAASEGRQGDRAVRVVAKEAEARV